MNLLKELSEWKQEYVKLFGGDERYEYLKKSLLVDRMSMVPTNDTLSFALYICFSDLTSFALCTCRHEQISGCHLSTNAQSNFLSTFS